MSDHGKHGEEPRRRRSFTPEFKAEIVELCQRRDRAVLPLGRDDTSQSVGVSAAESGTVVTWLVTSIERLVATSDSLVTDTHCACTVRKRPLLSSRVPLTCAYCERRSVTAG